MTYFEHKGYFQSFDFSFILLSVNKCFVLFQVGSFILDTEDQDPSLSSNFLLSQRMEGANLHTVTVDPETHARLQALLEAAGT